MATYVTLVNRVLESLNEITLATNGTDFTSSRGIQSAVKTFVNQSINDIYNSELQWSFLHSDGTQATTQEQQNTLYLLTIGMWIMIHLL